MLYNLVSRMDRSRFKNIVVSMTDAGAVTTRIQALNIAVFSLGMRLGMPNPQGLLRLVHFLRKESPQILQTWLYHADLLGLLAGSLTRGPAVVWNVRCSHMDMSKYSILSALVVQVLARLSAFPKAVVVNSETGRRFHENLGYSPRKWALIPNGFDLARFRPDPEARTGVRKELGLSRDTVLVGLVARFDPMKGHTNFFRAASLLLRDKPGVHFVLAGRGVDYSNPRIRKAITASGNRENFHLLGERGDIPHVTAALDIAASASFGEGFPNAIAEAMACGVPCVVTDVGDSAAIVGTTGRVVPPENPSALASACRELIDMGPVQCQKLGRGARELVASKYALNDVVTKYEDLYESLLN